MPVKKGKRGKKQMGGKIQGFATWSDYTKSPYYTQMKAEGRNRLLDDMRRFYEPGWKPPTDIDESKYVVPKYK